MWVTWRLMGWPSKSLRRDAFRGDHGHVAVGEEETSRVWLRMAGIRRRRRSTRYRPGRRRPAVRSARRRSCRDPVRDDGDGENAGHCRTAAARPSSRLPPRSTSDSRWAMTSVSVSVQNRVWPSPLGLQACACPAREIVLDDAVVDHGDQDRPWRRIDVEDGRSSSVGRAMGSPAACGEYLALAEAARRAVTLPRPGRVNGIMDEGNTS
jgi:hypothetical protein